MTEFEVKPRKIGFKRLFAVALAVCVVGTTLWMNAPVLAGGNSSFGVDKVGSQDPGSQDPGSQDPGSQDPGSQDPEPPSTETPTPPSTETPTPPSTETPTPPSTETPTPPAPPVQEVQAAAITLDQTAVTLVKGKSITLNATVSPANAVNKTIAWSTSDAGVATVTNGVVTAVKSGTATVTASTVNGKTAQCVVTVASVKLNATKAPIQKGKSSTGLAIEDKFPSTDKVSKWTTSNKKVVKVNAKSGKITGAAIGTANITVTMTSGASATCKVTVQKGKVVTKSLSVSQKKVTLLPGKKVTLTAKKNPVTAGESLKWSTSNKKVATVTSKGKVTAKKAGTATITVKASNGKKTTCKVTVPGVTLKANSATVKAGKTTTIKVKSTVVKRDKVASYKSSNTKVATVSNKGVVKGVKKGSAKINITMKSGAKATFSVKVK